MSISCAPSIDPPGLMPHCVGYFWATDIKIWWDEIWVACSDVYTWLRRLGAQVFVKGCNRLPSQAHKKEWAQIPLATHLEEAPK